MAGEPQKKKWTFISLALLFAISISVAGQGTHTAVEAQNHEIDTRRSGSTVEEMRHEHKSVQSEREPAPAGPLSRTEGEASSGEKKDLKAFFVIGFIINILLISAFLFWAARQWRKTKQE